MSMIQGTSLVLVLTLCSCLATAQEVLHSQLSQDVENLPETNVTHDSELDPEAKDRDRFIGSLSTTTYTDVVMVTSTVFFSCLSGTSTVLCQGKRRKKSLFSVVDVQDNDDDNSGLDSSIVDYNRDPRELGYDEETTELSPEESRDVNSKFLGLIFWTITRTTTTVTMLYTDTRTTIRLSYFCQAGQVVLPINRCG
ncbi:uncharacterized protein [Cherax quadricarinatus]|uniref:uncharacterized protein n=1 Tax=Cherax quadricarinatus TaxID=27406 RepID=UPI00387EBDC1